MRNIGYLSQLFLLTWALSTLAHVATSDSEESASLTDAELHSYYRTLAEKAVRQLNDPSEGGDYWRLDGLTDVKRQVMDGEKGVKYQMTVSVVKTECSTDGRDRMRIGAGLCAVREDAERKTCIFDIRISDQPVGESERAEHITKQRCSSSDSSILLHQTARKSPIPKSIKPKDVSHWHKFTAYTRRHSKSYVEDKREMLKRFRIYKRNAKIAAMWQELDEGSAVYGDTIFSDLSPSEFRRTYLPYRWQAPQYPIRTASWDELNELSANDKLPAAWNWREKGVVTAVKNQKMCGSCWAFSVTGNVEGQWAIKKGKLVSLSEQELVDCDKLDMGCNGGLPANAYKEIIRMGGLEPENAYPYDAHREQCHLVAKDIAVYINDSVQLPVNETYMAIWLFKNGPISIGLNAQFMQFYRHGVSHPWKILCEPWFLDHGVLIVGYGVEGKKPFWVIKNSWGADWGESGYYRLYRGKDVCGVSQMATSAIVK